MPRTSLPFGIISCVFDPRALLLCIACRSATAASGAPPLPLTQTPTLTVTLTRSDRPVSHSASCSHEGQLLALIDADWAGNKQIIVLEPRRVAARAAASRMASLISDQLGGKVGYRVRHESKASASTRVLVVTTGVLVRRLQSDPSLEGVAAVIFDEFHERSVDADLALALCRVAQEELRPELRLLVMSATLGSALAPAVSSLLGDCPTLSSSGRSFPVEVNHISGSRPLGMAASGHPRDVEGDVADAVSNVLSSSQSGDVLVFLPGEREIRTHWQWARGVPVYENQYPFQIGEYCALLEDRYDHPCCVDGSLEREHAEAIVKALAALHAAFWEREDVLENPCFKNTQKVQMNGKHATNNQEIINMVLNVFKVFVFLSNP